MDMSSDLYHSSITAQLNPPAIISGYNARDSLENRLMVAHHLGNKPYCDVSDTAKRRALREVNDPARPLEGKFFFDEKSGLYFQFMTDPKNKDSLIAAQVYYPNAFNLPRQLVRIVYFGVNETYVIIYHDSDKNFSDDGIINWAKSSKIKCVQKDDGAYEKEVRDAYNSYLEKEQLEQIRKKRREDEENRVVMIAKMHNPMKSPRRMVVQRKTIPKA